MGGSCHNVPEGSLQRSPTHQKPIHILHLQQLLRILIRHTPSVDDPQLVCCSGQVFLQEFPQVGMYFFDLFYCCNLACPNGPHWLISEYDVVPRFLVIEGFDDSAELSLTDLVCLVGFPLLESLPEAGNHTDSTFLQHELDLVSDDLISLTEEGSPFRVAQDDPGNVGILEMLHTHLPRVSSKAIG